MMAKIDYNDGSFEPQPSKGFNSACAWYDDGCVTVVTGDDGFGLRLNDEDLEQFIAFLREIRRRKVQGT
jgi:hypothetical protein